MVRYTTRCAARSCAPREAGRRTPPKSEKKIALHPHSANPRASLWPGRNYGGYGEWHGALDWNKCSENDCFYRRRVRPAAVKIGQPDLRFYDLRPIGASLFAGSGMPLAVVAAALCHSDTATTYKSPPRVLPRRLRLRHGTARFLDGPFFSAARDPAHHVSAPKRRLAQFGLIKLPQQH